MWYINCTSVLIFSLYYFPSSNLLFLNRQYLPSKSMESWNLADTDKYVNCSVNIKELLLLLKLHHLKEFDDYITLHNLSMLLTFVVTLTLCTAATEEVVNISNTLNNNMLIFTTIIDNLIIIIIQQLLWKEKRNRKIFVFG